MLEWLISIDKAATLAINGSSSLYLDSFAVLVSSTWVWLPLALVLFYAIIRSNTLLGILLAVSAIALCILLADQGASTVCKPLFHRFRPTQDPSIMYEIDVVNGYRSGLYGFISSHAANTFAVAVFVAKMMPSRALRACLFSWALLNCWSRVYLGVHFLGDVTVGAIYGAAVGLAVFALYGRLMKRFRLDAAKSSFSRCHYRDMALLSVAFAATFALIAILPAFNI